MKKYFTKRNGIIAAVLATITTVVMLAVPNSTVQVNEILQIMAAVPAGQVQVVNASGAVLSTHSTIASCLSAVQSGQLCAVGAGTYNEQVTISKSGIALVANDGKANIKRIKITSDNVTVKGQFVVKDSSSDNCVRTEANFLVIDGIECSSTDQDGVWFFGHDNVFRNMYIHDILASTVTRDAHADCFQTWDWDWETYNVLFENNVCDHTRGSGSNQIVMLSGSAHHMTFRGNRFIMHDAGYSPLALYGGTGHIVENNYFCNTTNGGSIAVYISGASNVTVRNNVYVGWSSFTNNASQTGTIHGSLPCVVFPSGGTSTPISATPTKTATNTPSRTPVTSTPTQIPSSITPSRTPTLTVLPSSPTTSPTETRTATIVPTITKTKTPVPATPTPAPSARLCVKITWWLGVSIRPSASTSNVSFGPGYSYNRVIPIEAIEQIGADEWARVNWGQWFAVKIGTRNYAQVAQCPN